MGLVLLGFLGCSSSSSDDHYDSVRVTVQGLYQKRTPSGTSRGSLVTRPARYAFVELRRNSDSYVLATAELNADGTGTASIPRGERVFAVLVADVLPPTPGGTGFALHGSVKKAQLNASYSSGEAFRDVNNWTTTSSVFTADADGTLSIEALESTSEAGAFAIADQMVEFALGIGRLEPNLPLPNLHTFWTSGTGSTYPQAVTNSSQTILKHPFSNRPILAHELWYGGPSNCAEAFNESLLQETFARSLFAYGSYWTTNSQSQTTYGSIIRGDNDNAYTNPWVAAESTMAFATGFGNFLSGALRNDPNLYSVDSNGSVTSWSLATHDFTPTGGGEFYGSSVARSLWGIWKTALGGNQANLQTLWNATVPTLANESYEYGKAPLGCYPTYLVGLKRLAGTVNLAGIQAQLSAENIGDINTSYFASTALWETIPVSSTPQTGSLTTYNNSNQDYWGVYYDRDQAQAYRFEHGGGTRTITVTSSVPLLVELFDSYGFYASTSSNQGAPGVLTLANLPYGTYAVRVRLNPTHVYNGNPAAYSLTVN
jgi:hypothetical protein